MPRVKKSSCIRANINWKLLYTKYFFTNFKSLVNTYNFDKGKEIQGGHIVISKNNFNLNTKINKLLKCDSNEKQYTIKTNTFNNIIQHIKKWKYCVVNQDFNQFIYERTENTEAENLKNKRDREVEEDESIEVGLPSSDWILSTPRKLVF
jgi:hypothetical protein